MASETNLQIKSLTMYYITVLNQLFSQLIYSTCRIISLFTQKKNTFQIFNINIEIYPDLVVSVHPHHFTMIHFILNTLISLITIISI